MVSSEEEFDGNFLTSLCDLWGEKCTKKDSFNVKFSRLILKYFKEKR